MNTRGNAPLDIELLMERIRRDISRRRKDSAERTAETPSSDYVPGQLLQFLPAGSANAYLGRGWSYAEPEYRWTEGDVAELLFKFEKPPGDLVLSLTAQPFVGGDVDSQEVTAQWNGTVVGSWLMADAGTYHSLILSPLSTDSTRFCLRFDLPRSFSPLSKGLGSDARRLGLAFRELVLRPAQDLGFR